MKLRIIKKHVYSNFIYFSVSILLLAFIAGCNYDSSSSVTDQSLLYRTSIGEVLVVQAVPGSGLAEVSLASEAVLCPGENAQDCLYNLYLASAPGVNSENWSSLPDGAKYEGVSLPFTITGLENGKTYYISAIYICSAGGSGALPEAMVTPYDPNTSAFPWHVNVESLASGDGSVTVNWAHAGDWTDGSFSDSAPSSQFTNTGYTLYYQEGGLATVNSPSIANILPGATSQAVGGLKTVALYCFGVSQSKDQIGAGPIGAQKCIVPGQICSSDIGCAGPPQAVTETKYLAYKAQTVMIDVLANDINGQTITSVQNPANEGGCTSIVDNKIKYEGQCTRKYEDTFIYTMVGCDGTTSSALVRVRLKGKPKPKPRPIPGNNPPVAVDDTASVITGQTILINVLTNDFDPDGDPLTITAVQNPANRGGITAIVGNQIQYNSSGADVFPDNFTYTISDGKGGTDTATVTVNRTNSPPNTVDDMASVSAGQTIMIDVLANDSDPDGDPLTITTVQNPSSNGGTTSIAGNKIVYNSTGATGFPDTFTYTVSDGMAGAGITSSIAASNTATVTINYNNSPPVAVNDGASVSVGQIIFINVLTNDSDPDGDPLTITAVQNPADNGGLTTIVGNQIRYDSSGATGFPDTFTYNISDGNGGVDTATVTINYNNSPPVAVNDSFDIASLSSFNCFSSALNFNVLTNDSDPDSDPLTIISFTQPAFGTITAGAGNTLDYNWMNFNFTTPSYTFNYTISDGNGGSDSAMVTIDFSGCLEQELNRGFGQE